MVGLRGLAQRPELEADSVKRLAIETALTIAGWTVIGLAVVLVVVASEAHERSSWKRRRDPSESWHV